jgi:hypothetical protein
MNNSAILKKVLEIRKDSDKKSQQQQIDENKQFFDLYPAIFLMARDKNMDIETFKYFLDLKNQVDIGTVQKDQMDVLVGKIFYDKYVNIKE